MAVAVEGLSEGGKCRAMCLFADDITYPELVASVAWALTTGGPANLPRSAPARSSSRLG